MNRDDGTIRTIPDLEVITDREVALLDREAEVLARYAPPLRPELLRRWRHGELKVDHGQLVDASKAAQRIRSAADKHAHRKRRRHDAAVSRTKNRRRK